MNPSIWVALIASGTAVLVGLIGSSDLSRIKDQQVILKDLRSTDPADSPQITQMRAALDDSIRRHHARATERIPILRDYLLVGILIIGAVLSYQIGVEYGDNWIVRIVVFIVLVIAAALAGGATARILRR